MLVADASRCEPPICWLHTTPQPRALGDKMWVTSACTYKLTSECSACLAVDSLEAIIDSHDNSDLDSRDCATGFVLVNTRENTLAFVARAEAQYVNESASQIGTGRRGTKCRHASS
jgi:hypothetical protein